MISALNIFNALIGQTRISDGLFQYFRGQSIPLDFSDLLRWQWILVVSALDKYIHDIVRIGMVEAFEGRRTQTSKFREFRITMSGYTEISGSSTPAIDFEKEIVRQHSFLAFQSPDKISDVLSYIWDEKNKWDAITNNLATPISASEAKIMLKNIVVRRNQIVHEGDCLVIILPLEQQPILPEDVQNVLNFVTELANAIYKCIK